MEPISVWAVPERATHAAEARRNPERWWAEGSIWTDRLVSALATASKEQLAKLATFRRKNAGLKPLI